MNKQSNSRNYRRQISDHLIKPNWNPYRTSWCAAIRRVALHNGVWKEGKPMVQCPECGSTNISKNGKRQGKQNHICNLCRRQFIENPSPRSGYPEDLKRECLKMYVNGLGFRAIERIKGVHHTMVTELVEVQSSVGLNRRFPRWANWTN